SLPRLIPPLYHHDPPPMLCALDAPSTAVPYPLSLHDALPISAGLSADAVHAGAPRGRRRLHGRRLRAPDATAGLRRGAHRRRPRSEEHTSELQSRGHLVCRLLLEKKKNDRRTSKSKSSPTEV